MGKRCLHPGPEGRHQRQPSPEGLGPQNLGGRAPEVRHHTLVFEAAP